MGTITRSDDLLDVGDVADLLEVPPATVRRWLRLGRLHGVKSLSGARWLIQRDDLLAAAPELRWEDAARERLIDALVKATGASREAIERVIDEP